VHNFRCARDLVSGDIACLIALEEWQDETADLGDEIYFVQTVLESGSGRKRIFGNLFSCTTLLVSIL
jgi:hypothetical protein